MAKCARASARVDQVLKRNPRHFGTLSGLGQIYLQMEDNEKALFWFRRALEVNPNLVGTEFEIKRLEEELRQRARDRRASR